MSVSLSGQKLVHLTPKSSFILTNNATHGSESTHVWAFSALRSHPSLWNSCYVHQVLLAKAKSPPKADQALAPSAPTLSNFHTEDHPSALSQPAPSPHPNLTSTALTSSAALSTALPVAHTHSCTAGIYPLREVAMLTLSMADLSLVERHFVSFSGDPSNFTKEFSCLDQTYHHT